MMKLINISQFNIILIYDNVYLSIYTHGTVLNTIPKRRNNNKKSGIKNV
jgi:hypothetical protein